MVDLCGEDGQSGSGETGASITDTDGDGIYDHIETGGDGTYNEGVDTDPNNADTDGDGLSDGEEDTNRDGSVNGNESNPRSDCSPFAIGLECDFDGDGWINLFDWDDDGDGVVDLKDADKFNPESDTDNDGLSDMAERGNSNPLNPCDPDDDAAACIGTDNDHDGFYTNVPANDPKYDSDDSDACVPESGNGVCDGCTVSNNGRMVICHRPFGTSVPFKFNLEIYARDWAVYKSLGGICGPCNEANNSNSSNNDDDDDDDDDNDQDSDGDGLTDLEETGGDGVYHASTDSDPFNPCDPSPTNGECEGVDTDNDGYFGNYPVGHSAYDPDDSEACVPVNNCDDNENTGTNTNTSADYRTIADGNWNDAASWENGNIPPIVIENVEVIVNHNITVQNTITIKGGGSLGIEGGDVFAIENGQLDIEDGTVVVKDISLDIQNGLHLKNTNSNLQMIDGDLVVGGVLANDNGSIHLENISLDVGNVFANTNGSTHLENICLKVAASYTSTNSTAIWRNVCAEIGTNANGSFQLSEASTIQMDGAKIKLSNGGIMNTTNSEVSGTIDAIYILNGNLENFANWTATISDYCVSGNVSVPSTYLPANQNCNAMEDAFDDCNCLDD